MSVGRSYLHEPESCICSMCKHLMRLSRVPSLKALNSTEFYFKCDDCDYTSAQLTEITSGELVCDIHPEADLKPTASDLWCEREIAELLRESGARSEDRPPRAGQLPTIPGLPPVDDGAVATRGLINADKRMPMLRRPGYALSRMTTFGVESAILAALAGYFVVASLTGSGVEPQLQMVSLQPTMHSKNEPTESEMALDAGYRTAMDLTHGMANSTNQVSVRNYTSPVLDPPDTEPLIEGGRLLFAAGDMAAARSLSTRAAETADVTAAGVDQTGFLFAESNVRYLTRAELEKLSGDELRIARNEIFARRGRFFKGGPLSAHFEKFAWYQPSTRRVRLNLIEEANIDLIRSLEASSTTRSVASRRPPT
jgi:hypothetical protein